MRNQRIAPCLVTLSTLLALGFSAVSVLGQGGTGKMPPPQRNPPPPIRKMPAPNRNPPPDLLPSCSAKSPKQATGRTHTVDLGGGVKLEMVEIPAGGFCMGSTSGGREAKPVHQVTISQPFYMGRYEVTQALWQSVMGNNPGSFKDCGSNCPVESVSWNDAQDFIKKLNEANDGFTYRLPSEAEWEYACRAGTTGDYYAGQADAIGWYEGNSGNRTHAVGGKQPNAFGLYDMSGNVSEWCQDWYHDSYNRAPSDGSAWLRAGDPKYRIERGGSYFRSATQARSANRAFNPPDPRYYPFIGFRVVAIARTQ